MKAHETPSDVQATEGHVLVDGPGGIAVTLTPDAAEKTAERLIEHADQARANRPKP